MSEWIMPGDTSIIPEGSIGFTYLIVNELTFQSYIGFRTFRYGWKDYYGSSKDIKEDIKKYGKENFTRGMIRIFNNKEDLSQHEVNLQISLNVLWETFEDGSRMFYNRIVRGVGFNATGQTRSAETRKKISIANRNPSDETRKRKSEAKKHPSDETRKKLSEAQTGKVASEATRKKLSDARQGQTNSVASNEKRRIASSNPSDETRKKMRDASKGRVKTEEHRQNLRNSHIGKIRATVPITGKITYITKAKQ